MNTRLATRFGWENTAASIVSGRTTTMRATGFICAALALAPATLADRPRSKACNNKWRGFYSARYDPDMEECHWYSSGSARCGTSNYHLTEVEGWKLVAWTRDEGIDDLIKFPERAVSLVCWKRYGFKCISGYRELWCRMRGGS